MHAQVQDALIGHNSSRFGLTYVHIKSLLLNQKCCSNNDFISITIFLYGNVKHMASSTDAYSHHPDNIIKNEKRKAITFLAYWLKTLRRQNWRLLSYLSSCWLPNVKHRRPVKCEESKTWWRTKAWGPGLRNYKQRPTVNMWQKCRNPASFC